MTMREQIKMSGLEITTSSPLQWNSTNQWSPLLGGGRQHQACVVVSGNGENDAAAAQTVVVLGGLMGGHANTATNSVIIWDPSTQDWRNGPNLNDRRGELVAVVCRDKVYAIGGRDENRQVWDTMESIQGSSLLENNGRWTRLQCRLSSPRQACAAVVVHNRYVVIMGGHTFLFQDSSSVDIMDTAPPHSSNGEPTIVAGPRMNSARSAFGAAAMDNRIFVVGGWVNLIPSASVESLAFPNSLESLAFPNSSWRVEKHLTLSSERYYHAVAKVGSCLVVAAGLNRYDDLVVQVLDVQRGIVWRLPNLISARRMGCSMVSLSESLVVLGGNHLGDSAESLALAVNTKHQRCYKLLKFLIGIEFLGRPTRKRNI